MAPISRDSLSTNAYTRPLVYGLMALHLLQLPLQAARAAGVTPTTPGVALDTAANGVPIVNIAAPNGAGISRNSYTNFNVASQGLILNNSAQPVNTQLGGFITGNAKLGAGSARLILNEVTAPNPSQLKGYLEVAGARAGVVVANPYGITCNGCGFINTNQATLSTGVPLWKSDGSLAGFEVRDGLLRIEGAGLNANNTDGLALYARTLELNADLYAQALSVVTGTNRIDADSGTATPLVPTSTAAGYAIDSSALGGMYANTIRLVGTEAGVGMRLAGPVAALTGQLEILGNGDVRLARTSAKTGLTAQAQGSLTLTALTAAGGHVSLQAGTTMELANGVQLSASSMDLGATTLTTGTDSAIAAGSDLDVTAADQHYAGTLGSNGVITLTGSSITNLLQIAAANGLVLSADDFTNSGAVDIADGSMTLSVTGLLDNAGGSLRHGGNSLLLQSATLDNRGGLIESAGSATLRATTLLNTGGTLQAGEDLALYLPAFDRTQNGGSYAAGNLLALHTSGNMLFSGEDFATPGQLLLEAGDHTIQIDSRVEAGDNAALVAGDIALGDAGFLATQGALFAQSVNLENLGLLYGRDGVALSVENELDNGDESAYRSAAILSHGDIRIATAANGRLAALNNFGGHIESLGGDITLRAEQLNNSNVGWSLATPWIEDLLPAYWDNCPHYYCQGHQRIANYMFNGSFICCYVAGGDNPAPVLFESGFYWPRYAKWWENVWLYRQLEEITHNDLASLGHAGTITADRRADSSGGNITIDAGTLDNDRSRVSAAGRLDITADSIVNTATSLFDTYERTVDSAYKECPSDGDCWRVNGQHVVTRGDLDTRADQIITSVLEGSEVELHGTTVTNHDDGVAGDVIRGATQVVPTGFWAGIPVAGPANPIGGINQGILDPTLLPGFNLPGNGLFILSTNPAHPYLIETDPALNTYAAFLGSAYLLGHLEGWAPGVTQRRLGDGYYEITLVREALLASLGSRFLDPAIADEKAQFEYLMNNAIAASGALHLSPGVALTREQIDALQADIVWMEERTVGSQKVLVPVVYLAQGSMRVLRDGAVIGGGSLVVDSGEFRNDGLVRAHDSLVISAASTLANQGGHLQSDGELLLQSGGDIRNESGQISGTDVVLQAAGDITHRTTSATEYDAGGNTSSWGTRVGEAASVEATGNLLQVAGSDLQLEGARLAAENIALAAGGSITLSTVQVRQGYTYNSADWQAAEEYVRQLQTKVEATSELRLMAAADITAIAASLKGNDVVVEAGRHLSLLAAEESDHLESHSQHDGTVEDKSFDLVHDASRMVGTRIEARGDLALSAGQGNVTLFASTAEAGGDARVSAAGSINLIAGVNTTQHSEQSSKTSDATFNEHDEGFVSQSAVASGIMARGNLGLDAGGDIALVASSLASGQTLRIGGSAVDQAALVTSDSASGTLPLNLQVSTLELTNASWNETRKGFSGPMEELVRAANFIIAPMLTVVSADQLDMPEITLGEHSSHRTQDLLQAGSLLAAQDMAIRVQDTAAFVGAELSVPGTLAISANNIVIDAAAETHSVRHEEGKDTVQGLGPEFNQDKGEYRLAGVQETRTSVVDAQTVTQWRGTSVNAGNLILKAEQDINILGSQLAVVGSAIMEAGDDLTIGGREGMVTQEHSETVETITVGVAVRNAYHDAVQAIEDVNDAKEALEDAKAALDNAERKVALGQLAASDLEYFRVNVTAAAANLAQSTISAAGALTAAAATVGATVGTGFYMSGSAQHDTVTTTSSSVQTLWQGSELAVGNSALLRAGNGLTVQGSTLGVADLLALEGDRISITAGTERSTATMKTTESHESAGGSVSPGNVSATVGVSVRETDADSSATHYVNSHVAAGTLVSRSDVLRVAGARIVAEDVDIDARELLVASLQDESSSRSETRGSSLGLSFGYGSGDMNLTSSSGGVEQSESQSDSRWVAEQTWILGTNSIHVRADDTLLTGAVIANAEVGAGGILLDKGNLDFETANLVFTDLNDYQHSKTTGFNFNTGINTSAFRPEVSGQKTGDGRANGETTLGGQYFGHKTEQVTRATLGLGNVVIGGQPLGGESNSDQGSSNLNRDLFLAQEITRDQDIGGLNASITIDNRWVTDSGPASIVKDFKDIPKNLQIVAGGIEADIQLLTTDIVPDDVADALRLVDKASLGLLPFDDADIGGMVAQLPVLAGAKDIHQKQFLVIDASHPLARENPELFQPSSSLPGYDDLEPQGKASLEGKLVSIQPFTSGMATFQNFTNGMFNTMAEASVNGLEQTKSDLYTLNYNPRHGFLADVLEIGVDKAGVLMTKAFEPVSAATGLNIGFASGTAWETGAFMADVMRARSDNGANFAAHSQGNLLIQSGLLRTSLEGIDMVHVEIIDDTKVSRMNFSASSYGSPVNNQDMNILLNGLSIRYASSVANPGDFVAGGFGGNYGTYQADTATTTGVGSNVRPFFGLERWLDSGNPWDLLRGTKYPVAGKPQSAHSSYHCELVCGSVAPWQQL